MLVIIDAIIHHVICLEQNAAKQAAAAATQTIAAAQNAAASNKNTMSHQQLVFSCKVLWVQLFTRECKFEINYPDFGFVDALQAVADHIPQLVQGMRGSQAHPEDLGAQLALIIASQSFLQVKHTILCLLSTPDLALNDPHVPFFVVVCVLFVSKQPGSKMVSSAKAAVPTVTDQAAAMQLGQCAKNLATCLAELRTAAQKVPTVHCLIVDLKTPLNTWGVFTRDRFGYIKTNADAV